MYTKKQKSVALLVCAAFLFVTFASLLFIVKEADHICVGNDCPVCAAVAEAENTLNRLKNGIALFWAILAVTAALFLLFAGADAASAAVCSTPVAQRVRMND